MKNKSDQEKMDELNRRIDSDFDRQIIYSGFNTEDEQLRNFMKQWFACGYKCGFCDGMPLDEKADMF